MSMLPRIRSLYDKIVRKGKGEKCIGDDIASEPYSITFHNDNEI